MPRFLVRKELYQDGFFFNAKETNKKYPVGSVIHLHTYAHTNSGWFKDGCIYYEREVDECWTELTDTW